MSKAWRRQSSADWAACAVTDLCDENQAWTTGSSRLRAHSNDEFRDAVTEAAALHSRDVTDLLDESKAWTTGWRGLRAHGDAHFKEAVAEAAAHAHDDLFSRHIDLEPAPEDPVDWAMAEASDDEDDAPMPDAPPEPEIIDMPPAQASARPMSNLERCIALRLLYGAGPRRVSEKCLACPLSCVPCPGSMTRVRSPECPAQAPRQKVFFFFGRGREGAGGSGGEGRWLQMVMRQGDFCAVLYTVFCGGS